MTPSDGVEREDPAVVKERQDAARVAAIEERRVRLGHVEKPKKKSAKSKGEPKEPEAA